MDLIENPETEHTYLQTNTATKVIQTIPVLWECKKNVNKRKQFSPLGSPPTTTYCHSLPLQHKYNWGETQPSSRTLFVLCVCMCVCKTSVSLGTCRPKLDFSAEIKSTVHARTNLPTLLVWVNRKTHREEQQSLTWTLSTVLWHN